MEVGAGRRLRAVAHGPVTGRAAEWLRRLAETKCETVPAADLYAGAHWRAAREAAGLAGRAWVASAGYGLIPFDAPIHPYSATFAPGEPDSVVPPKAKSRPADPADWWDALAKWSGPAPGAARRLADLASPGGFLLVAGPSRTCGHDP